MHFSTSFCRSVDTRAGFPRAEWCLCRFVLYLLGAQRRRQESEPEGHSCFSVSTFSACKSLSTNHLIHVDTSVQTLKQYNLGSEERGRTVFSTSLTITSYCPLLSNGWKDPESWHKGGSLGISEKRSGVRPWPWVLVDGWDSIAFGAHCPANVWTNIYQGQN